MAVHRKSLGEFAVDAFAVADGLPKAMAAATAEAALVVTDTVRGEIREDTGGDMVLSSMGARLGARYDIKGTENPVALIQATGPMQIIERDTKPHQILPGGVGRARGRTKAARRAAKQGLYDALFGNSYGSGVKPLSTPYGPKMRVNHPGTKGKKTWSRGIEKSISKVPRIYQDSLAKHLRKFFR